ncbi:MAG: phosphoribosyl-AMP cyclohydrolase [Chloroflexota bacterium]
MPNDAPFTPLDEAAIAALRWDASGLIPAVVQDHNTGAVLMVAYMNVEALRHTLTSGDAVFWSRSRQALWRKGETSGNVQRVRAIYVDCDADTLLLQVDPAGPACHTGEATCFFRTLDDFAFEPTSR